MNADVKNPRICVIRNCRGITDVTGAEAYLLTLMRGLQAAGAEVELVCAMRADAGETPWLRTLRDSGLPHHLVDVASKTSLADLRALMSRIKAFNPGVLHAIDNRSDVIAVLASRRSGVPAVASFFGWTNFEAGTWRGLLYPVVDRFIMRRLQRIIVDSKHIGEQIKLPARNIAVIPNGVDTNRFDPDTVPAPFKRRWFGREDITLVGTIGRIHPNKGHLDLCEAAGHLIKTRPDLRFVVIGDPPSGYEEYGRKLADRIASLGLQDAFLVLNVPSAEIPQAIASFDITALPSYMESLSYVMLESMAMKKPVVSARVGGHGALIDHGRNGLLFDAGDVATLTDLLNQLAGDTQLRHRVGAAGQASVHADYSVDAMIAKTLDVYRGAMST